MRQTTANANAAIHYGTTTNVAIDHVAHEVASLVHFHSFADQFAPLATSHTHLSVHLIRYECFSVTRLREHLLELTATAIADA